ncbi:SatD family protein [Humibacillus xanthopallidus]|uniref:SatD family protein n=1 Tax=Humibacillus xanthopallidus TaxID=412689 RepID=A0A543I094_9MICO|nr:SatD family protein [Humibacillus xanthopallidus]TQM64018.1 SatD family protein [Humibacillus xanthopallidus]
MDLLKHDASPVALIGDVVRSRTRTDRQALHDELSSAIDEANRAVVSEDPLVITVGDEFQGVYASLGQALHASFVVRAVLHPRTDVRFGLGRGTVTTLDPVRGIHDGPAYWAARDAIVMVEERARKAQTRTSRTAYVGPEDAPATVAAVQSALDCLDFMVGSMSSTSREIFGGLMSGHTQHQLAERLGLSASAVSQRVRRDGIGVALEAAQRLWGLP